MAARRAAFVASALRFFDEHVDEFDEAFPEEAVEEARSIAALSSNASRPPLSSSARSWCPLSDHFTDPAIVPTPSLAQRGRPVSLVIAKLDRECLGQRS
jgi:hypothetical protein